MSESDVVPTPPSKKLWMLPTITGVVGLILGGAFVAGGTALATSINEASAAAKVSTLFEDTLVRCTVTDTANAQIADEGKTLTVNSKGEDDVEGLPYDDLDCILDGLGATAAVMSHFQQTTSMDGRQTEEWGDLELSWSYHPDRGADFVVTLDSDED